MGKLSKDRRDVFYQKAKVEGYRARSAYKLLQLNEKFNLFHSEVNYVVDLCAAPGSWSQVAREKLDEASSKHLSFERAANLEFQSAVIVAVDIQEMAPIEGVLVLKGDITLSETFSNIRTLLKSSHADLIMSDGAPDITGLHDMDEYIQNQLLLASFGVSIELLRPGGTFVAKVFRGENISFVYLQLHSLFGNVHCCKPTSSRNSSLEAFVVCTNFGHPLPSLHKDLRFAISNCLQSYPLSGNKSNQDREFHQSKRDTDWKSIKFAIPFIACGDLGGLDSNRNYDLDESHIFIDPIQPPIDAPYNTLRQI